MEFIKSALLRAFAPKERSNLDEIINSIELQLAESRQIQQKQDNELSAVLNTLTALVALQQQANEQQANQDRRERKGFVNVAIGVVLILAIGWLTIPSVVGTIEKVAVEKAESGARSIKAQLDCDFSWGYKGDCREEVIVTLVNMKDKERSGTQNTSITASPVNLVRAASSQAKYIAAPASAVTSFYDAVQRIEADPVAGANGPRVRSIEATGEGFRVEFFPPVQEVIANGSTTDSISAAATILEQEAPGFRSSPSTTPDHEPPVTPAELSQSTEGVRPERPGVKAPTPDNPSDERLAKLASARSYPPLITPPYSTQASKPRAAPSPTHPNRLQ